MQAIPSDTRSGEVIALPSVGNVGIAKVEEVFRNNYRGELWRALKAGLAVIASLSLRLRGPLPCVGIRGRLRAR